MKSRTHAVSALSAALAVTVGALAGCWADGSTPVFTLSSPDLAGGTFPTGFILNGFGCTGGNVSPELQWANVPSGTKSLALQVYDPDAPSGSGFWHWAIYDIPPDTTGLARGVGNNAALLPAGAFGGNTDFLDTGVTGVNGNYGGPCPPAGDPPHRYIFTLLAVAVDKLRWGGVPKTGTAGLYGFVLNKGIGANLLGKASFIAMYGR
jgi:Raf kinase inhibitor-like YbhB/YbcL family protein